MSNYRNFIQDFPVRCGEILKDYQEQARKNEREVTHMLAIAAASFLIPFERLRRQRQGTKHPAGDKVKYPQAAGKFGNLSDRNMLGSRLWQGEAGSWQIGEIPAQHVKQEPETWAQCSESLPADVKVVAVLECMRNAFAHGNIYTLPDGSDQIRSIIFLSKIMEGRRFTGKYKLLAVSPNAFNTFLLNWIDFLKRDLRLPRTNEQTT